MDHLGTLHIQVLSFGLLVLAAHFMGKITYHLNFGELIGQLLGGILVNPYLLRVIHVGGKDYTLAFQNFYFFTFIFLSVVAFSLGEELHLSETKKRWHQRGYYLSRANSNNPDLGDRRARINYQINRRSLTQRDL